MNRQKSADSAVDVVSPVPVCGKRTAEPDFHLVVVAVCAGGTVPPHDDLHELIVAPCSCQKSIRIGIERYLHPLSSGKTYPHNSCLTFDFMWSRSNIAPVFIEITLQA
jgi:hypothetical protein